MSVQMENPFAKQRPDATVEMPPMSPLERLQYRTESMVDDISRRLLEDVDTLAAFMAKAEPLCVRMDMAPIDEVLTFHDPRSEFKFIAALAAEGLTSAIFKSGITAKGGSMEWSIDFHPDHPRLAEVELRLTDETDQDEGNVEAA